MINGLFDTSNLTPHAFALTDTAKASPIAAGAEPPLAKHTAPAAMVFRRTTFERTAAHLASGVVLLHLQTLSDHAESLLGRLLAPEILADTTNTLTEAAHALASSAGMFGFDRLCATALTFEHAMESNMTQTSMLAGDLVVVLKDSLDEMQKMLLELAAPDDPWR